jgi:hypothetical protein
VTHQPFIVTLIKDGEEARTMRVYAHSQEDANAKALRSNQGWTLGITMQRQRRMLRSSREWNRPTRNERILESGYNAYADEEDHHA